MSKTASGRAASGARLQGDDVQHLIVWYHVLKSQQENFGIEAISVESDGAGNLDDLVVTYTNDCVDEFWQVKASVDAKTPLNTDYLMKVGGKKASILQRMYASWLKLCESSKPVLPLAVLATTKSIDSGDNILAERATIDAKINEALKRNDSERRRWADHLSINENELALFLENLVIRHGLSEAEWREKIRDAAATIHVKSDPQAIALGVQQVRDWVKKPRHVFTIAELKSVIDTLSLRIPSKSGLVVVQMLDVNSRADQADASINFVNLFGGIDPSSRRKLVDARDSKKIFDGISSIRAQLRTKNIYDVEVDGPMRLPLWFLTGKLLGNTTGMIVSGRTSNGIWSSSTQPTDSVELVVDGYDDALITGTSIAVSVSLATDITSDVDEYVKDNLSDIPHIRISIPQTGSRALRDSAHVQAIVFKVREEMRSLDRKIRPSQIHLFLAMPGPGALLIGHVWDRLPPTLVYWDMGRPGAYHPAFEIN